MTHFEAISLVVAGLALIQPWLIRAWKSWFRRGQVEIYETGRLEAGNSNLGPTLALHGTLRALDHDVFVQSISLEVTRESDNATHHLEWAAFRSHEFGAAPELAHTLELPHSFIVLEAEPSRYNVIFRSPPAEREVQSLLAGVSRAWFDDPINQERRAILAAQGNLGLEFNQRVETAFKAFQQSPVFTNAYSELERRSYWEPGFYAVTLFVRVPKRKCPFSKRWRFELHSDECERLRRNVIAMLYFSCGMGAGWSYNFTDPEYLPPE